MREGDSPAGGVLNRPMNQDSALARQNGMACLCPTSRDGFKQLLEDPKKLAGLPPCFCG